MKTLRSGTITTRRTVSSQKEAHHHAPISRAGSMRTWNSGLRNSAKRTSALLVNDSPMLWAGWLSKTGSKDMNFHKRFFRLHANGNFVYYDKEDSTEPKGICKLLEATGVHPVKTGFNISTPTRVWQIARADDSQDIGPIVIQLQLLVDGFLERKRKILLTSQAQQAALKSHALASSQLLEHNFFASLMIPGPDKGLELAK